MGRIGGKIAQIALSTPAGFQASVAEQK